MSGRPVGRCHLPGEAKTSHQRLPAPRPPGPVPATGSQRFPRDSGSTQGCGGTLGDPPVHADVPGLLPAPTPRSVPPAYRLPVDRPPRQRVRNGNGNAPACKPCPSLLLFSVEMRIASERRGALETGSPFNTRERCPNCVPKKPKAPSTEKTQHLIIIPQCPFLPMVLPQQPGGTAAGAGSFCRPPPLWSFPCAKSSGLDSAAAFSAPTRSPGRAGVGGCPWMPPCYGDEESEELNSSRAACCSRAMATSPAQPSRTTLDLRHTGSTGAGRLLHRRPSGPVRPSTFTPKSHLRPSAITAPFALGC